MQTPAAFLPAGFDSTWHAISRRRQQAASPSAPDIGKPAAAPGQAGDAPAPRMPPPRAGLAAPSTDTGNDDPRPLRARSAGTQPTKPAARPDTKALPTLATSPVHVLERLRGLLSDLRAASLELRGPAGGTRAASRRLEEAAGAVLAQALSVRLDSKGTQAAGYFRALARECLAALPAADALPVVVATAHFLHAAGDEPQALDAAYRALGHVLHVSPRKPLDADLPVQTQALAQAAILRLEQEPEAAARCVAALAQGIGASRLEGRHILQLLGTLATPADRPEARICLVDELAGQMYAALGGADMGARRLQALFIGCLQPCLAPESLEAMEPGQRATNLTVLGRTAVQGLLEGIARVVGEGGDPAATARAWAQVSAIGQVLARSVRQQPQLVCCFDDLVLFEATHPQGSSSALRWRMQAVESLERELYLDLSRRTRTQVGRGDDAPGLLARLQARPGISETQQAALRRLDEVARALAHYRQSEALHLAMSMDRQAAAKASDFDVI